MRAAEIGQMLVDMEEDGSAKNRIVNALLVNVLAEAERNSPCSCSTCGAARDLGKWLSVVLSDQAPEYRKSRVVEEGPSL